MTCLCPRCFEATLYNRYKGSIYLVFDFCEHDLAGLLSNSNVKFTLAEIKKVMQMLLNGLYYIHRNKVPLQPYLSPLLPTHPIRLAGCLCGFRFELASAAIPGHPSAQCRFVLLGADRG